jgi:prepilin-type processing-associated H-X9-DG protein
MKQIGLGMMQYGQDYDETVVPYRVGGVPVGQVYNPFGNLPGTGAQTDRYQFFNSLLQPYIKSDQIWACPSNKRSWVNSDPGPGQDTETAFFGYGGQNSYGASNYVFQSNSGISLASIVESANTVGMVDARYYNVLPRTPNTPATTDTSASPAPRAAGEPCVLQGRPQGVVTNDNALYWKNIGDSYLFPAANGVALARPTDAEAEAKIRPYHLGMIMTLFMDGHVKAQTFDTVVVDRNLRAGSTNSIWDPYKQGCRVP